MGWGAGQPGDSLLWSAHTLSYWEEYFQFHHQEAFLHQLWPWKGGEVTWSDAELSPAWTPASLLLPVFTDSKLLSRPFPPFCPLLLPLNKTLCGWKYRASVGKAGKFKFALVMKMGLGWRFPVCGLPCWEMQRRILGFSERMWGW